jgi:hypothetical protein
MWPTFAGCLRHSHFRTFTYNPIDAMTEKEMNRLDERLRVLIPELPPKAMPTRGTLDAAIVFKKCAQILYDRGNEQALCSEVTMYGWRITESDVEDPTNSEAETWELAVSKFAIQLLDFDTTP